MRVVETVPGNMLPMVAQNIANLQNVAMQGHVLAAKKESHPEAAHATATNPEPQSKFNKLEIHQLIYLCSRSNRSTAFAISTSKFASGVKR